jgi:release factor H-coupled RctB family protein
MSTNVQASISVIASPKTRRESDADLQLRTAAALPGVVRAVGMPDLHPGLGLPTGAVFASSGWIYPALIGNDIGCGMALWQTDVLRRAVKLDRWERRLIDLDEPWSGDAAGWLTERGFDAGWLTIPRRRATICGATTTPSAGPTRIAR